MCADVTTILVMCGDVTTILVMCGDVTTIPVTCGDVTTMLMMCGDVTTDRSALKIVSKHWTQLLEEQDFLATPEGWRKMLALVPDKTKEMLDQEWQETETTSITKWRRLRSEVKVNFGSYF